MKTKTKTESGSARTGTNMDPESDWRSTMLVRIRGLIHEADPKIVEERKWVKPTNPAGAAVWSKGGMICTGETYKTHVKLTFARGASLPDPAGLFTSSLEGNARRGIDLHEGDTINGEALKELIRAAVALNIEGKSKPKIRQ